jgi:hypothetical protein
MTDSTFILIAVFSILFTIIYLWSIIVKEPKR